MNVNRRHKISDGGLPNCDRVMDRAASRPAHRGLTSDDVGRLVDAVTEGRP